MPDIDHSDIDHSAATGLGRHAVTGFVDADLRGTRFVRCDLSGAVTSGVNLSDAELDDPLLTDGSMPS